MYDVPLNYIFIPLLLTNTVTMVLLVSFEVCLCTLATPIYLPVLFSTLFLIDRLAIFFCLL